MDNLVVARERATPCRVFLRKTREKITVERKTENAKFKIFKFLNEKCNVEIGFQRHGFLSALLEVFVGFVET